MKNKIIIFVFAFVMPCIMHAQNDLKNLVGNWEVKAFVEKEKKMGFAETSFRISLSDAGDYLMDQVITKKGKEICYCQGMIVDNGDNLLDITVVRCSDEEKEGLCKFWLSGTYTWTLKNGILLLTGNEQQLELKRK